MKKLLLLVFWCTTLIATAQQPDVTAEGYLPSPVQVGDVFPSNIPTAHPYNPVGARGILFEREFHNKNSHYIKLYFERFDLAQGDYVELLGMNTGERVIYSEKGKIINRQGEMISAFWSQIIFDDRVRVRLYSNGASSAYGFNITQYAYGYPEDVVQQRLGIKAVCGNDDKESIACYRGTAMYDKGRAVCRLFLGGGGACTGWLLGCDGHVMTNNHCIGSASVAQNTDFVFNYEVTTCNGTTNATSTTAASSSTFIKTNSSLDYTLVQLPNNPSSAFGFLSLSSVVPVLNDRIYIVGHPGGRRKEITVNTDRGGVNGLAAVDQVTTNGIRYFADTEGGSSGSPVLSHASNLVFAIHNTGSCTAGNGSAGRCDRLIADIGTDMPNCGVDSGGTVVPTCGTSITSYPYTEGFETGLGNWQQATNDNIDWTRLSGATGSPNTGPTAASQGNFYAYIEASSPNFPNINAKLISPCFDLTNLSYPQLIFDYHMYGADMGNLVVEVSTNGVLWTQVWSLTGDQGNAWTTDTIDLNAYTTENALRIRFNGTTGTGFTSDIAIDEVRLEQGASSCSVVNTFPYTEGFETGIGAWEQELADDLDWTRLSGSTGSPNTGPTAASSGSFYLYVEASSPNFPSKTASIMSPCFDVSSLNFPELKFDYHMFGTDMGTLYVEASVGGGTWTTVWTRSGDQGNAWYTTTVDLAAYRNASDLRLRFRGVTGADFTSDMSIDAVSVGEAVFTCRTTITNYPYTEGFETSIGDWVQETGDDFDWTRLSGTTPSSGTGPSAASEGSTYIYAEATAPNNPSKVTILNSPCFDLSSTVAPTLEFDYHMDGTAVGSLVLEVRTSTTNWATLWSRSGSRGSNWLTATIALTPYINSTDLRFRFRATTGTTWSSDIAIDNINLNAGNPINVQLIEEEQVLVQVAPNPFNDYLEVATKGQEVLQYVILSVDGRVLQQGQVQGTQRLAVDDLTTGVYFIRFSNEKEQVTQKIVKY